MSADESLRLPGFEASDGPVLRVLHPTDHGLAGNIPPERVSHLRAARRVVRRRQLRVDSTTYTAFSAHDLLDMDSATRDGRPGMPY